MMTEEVATIDKLEPLLERLKQESALLASVMALHEAPRPA